MKILILTLSLFSSVSIARTFIPEEVKQRSEVYLNETRFSFDKYGLYRADNEIGDSALFSCLAYASGATEFDLDVLITEQGKPIRHPEITPKDSSTPISRDSFQGILLCLAQLLKSDPAKARSILSRVIQYGQKNSKFLMWNFCDDKDLEDYQIERKDYWGRCIMTPMVMQRTYKMARKLGLPCDDHCNFVGRFARSYSPKLKGFERHLAVVGILIDTYLDYWPNPKSMRFLAKAVADEPRNAFYQALLAHLQQTTQNRTWLLLSDNSLFPQNQKPNSKNYCTHYLFQRDEIRKEKLAVTQGCVEYLSPITREPVKECDLKSRLGFRVKDGKRVTREVYNDDWLPCESGPNEYPAIDWLLSYKIASGEIKQ